MAMDNNLLMALNTIATQQENTTECTAMLSTHPSKLVTTFLLQQIITLTVVTASHGASLLQSKTKMTEM